MLAKDFIQRRPHAVRLRLLAADHPNAEILVEHYEAGTITEAEPEAAVESDLAVQDFAVIQRPAWRDHPAFEEIVHADDVGDLPVIRKFKGIIVSLTP